MSLIHNERTKLTANAFNTAATSCFTIGVLAPLAAAFYNLGPGPTSYRTIGAGAVIWLAAAIASALSCTSAARRAEAVTDIQLFAFVYLPIGIMIVGTIIAELIIRHDRKTAASQGQKPEIK